ncbi:MAG: hypothetical protein AB1400_10815 [Pseudomonadota bacterium]
MLARLRREYANLVTSGAQLVLLAIGAHIGTRLGWLGSLAAMSALSLLAWLSALYRLRMVRDTPTSRIASAAQGYVELIGQGRRFGEHPLLAKLSQRPCLWYRYCIEHKNHDGDWRTEENGESEDSLLLEDGSGSCVIDPNGAEILTNHKQQWKEGDRRYTEWLLLEQESLYAIGQFHTLSGNGHASLNEMVKTILAEWKQDIPALHARFDHNGDGELDLHEWETARLAAQAEAEQRLTEIRTAPETHLLRCPEDGRLYLLSNLPPEKLARRYALWTWAHLAIFFGALAGFGWLYASPDF